MLGFKKKRNLIHVSFIDVEGSYIAPGLIDTHIHGFGGFGTEDVQGESILTMSRLLAELGVQRFFIQVIGLRGNSASTDTKGGVEWQVDPERWLTLVPEVAQEAALLGIHVIYPNVYLDAEEIFLCAGIVADNFFIFPNGRVYRCPLCEDYPIHSYQIENGGLVHRQGFVEDRFFPLQIPEGCVMNRLLQEENISYKADGSPLHRISCCLIKQEIRPAHF